VPKNNVPELGKEEAARPSLDFFLGRFALDNSCKKDRKMWIKRLNIKVGEMLYK